MPTLKTHFVEIKTFDVPRASVPLSYEPDDPAVSTDFPRVHGGYCNFRYLTGSAYSPYIQVSHGPFPMHLSQSGCEDYLKFVCRDPLIRRMETWAKSSGEVVFAVLVDLVNDLLKEEFLRGMQKAPAVEQPIPAKEKDPMDHWNTSPKKNRGSYT